MASFTQFNSKIDVTSWRNDLTVPWHYGNVLHWVGFSYFLVGTRGRHDKM